ncbi:fibronectin type III domain-containing protein [Heyndrickxia camelliae]|uniref:Fibronectin type III domain-containing protein n=1 Tax=Heyndrickxia camelliae TaxID=1707093 RepID=A0A2N3LKE7_9BACI|nr:fibronectin type III domain-containing protein [Heyndrickxia camelliae]
MPHPDSPQNLAGTTTITQANLTWDAVDGADSYKIYRNGIEVGTSSTNSYKDTGLTGDTTYQYQVSAVNVSGESAKSSEISLTTQPSTSGS